MIRVQIQPHRLDLINEEMKNPDSADLQHLTGSRIPKHE